MRGALKHAVWRGHVGRNVAALVQAPSKSKTNVEVFSEEDMGALYAALEGDRFRARWHLSLVFGLRPGEAIALEWKHVDFENSTIRIEQEILQIRGKGAVLEKFTKTNEHGRTIALPEYMMVMLAETRQQQMIDRAQRGDDWKTWEPDGEPHSFCFTRPDGAVLRPGYDTTLWKNLLTRAGLPHTRRYTARHTAASMAISDGDDPVTVADMLGHSTPATTFKVYAHPIEERKRRLADNATQRFLKHSKA